MTLPEKTIFDVYKSLNLWWNPVCRDCKSQTDGLSGPIAIWQVGESYEEDPYRLMLIGKTARGTIREPDVIVTELERNGYIDATVEADDWIRNDRRSAYWYYAADLLAQLYGSLDAGWDRVAFTNLVKCNDSMDVDTTSVATKQNCIDKLGVVWHELKILKPRNIILFTGDHYDDHIAKYTAGLDVSDVTDRQHFVKNGAKDMLWWERTYSSNGKTVFRLLRTSHPQYQGKEVFVNNLVHWVRGGSS